MDGHAEALIDLAAVARNVEAMREHVRGTPLMAVVKADGYGHGMIPAAHAAVAGGAQWLGRGARARGAGAAAGRPHDPDADPARRARRGASRRRSARTST